MKCKKCGTKLDKDSVFCEGCGAPVKRKSKSPLYISLIAGVSVLAVVAIVLIFNHVSGAYDRQIELGYELLEEGKYEEAILAFDKAIEIEEKRPEGYMGKAESMAHDPEMTTKKAEEIVEVLEEGYKKSGDKRVLEHSRKIGRILRDNGFDVEAVIVEGECVENPSETVVSPQKEENKFIFIGEGGVKKVGDKIIQLLVTYDSPMSGMSIKDLSGKEIRYIDGHFEGGIITDGNTAYVNNTGKIGKMNLETGETEQLFSLHTNLYAAFEGSKIFALYEDRLYVSDWTENEDTDHYESLERDYVYDLNTGELTEISTGVGESISVQYNSEVYYLYVDYTSEEYNHVLYKVDLDNNSQSVVMQKVGSFDIVGDYLYCSQLKNKAFNYGDSEFNIIKYNLLTKKKEVVGTSEFDEIACFTSYGYGYLGGNDHDKVYIKYYDGTQKEFSASSVWCSNDVFIVGNSYEQEEPKGDIEYKYWDEYVIINNKKVSVPFVVEKETPIGRGVRDYLDGIAYCCGYVYYEEKVVFN